MNYYFLCESQSDTLIVYTFSDDFFIFNVDF